MLSLQQPRRQFQTLNFRLFTQDMRVLKHFKHYTKFTGITCARVSHLMKSLK